MTPQGLAKADRQLCSSGVARVEQPGHTEVPSVEATPLESPVRRASAREIAAGQTSVYFLRSFQVLLRAARLYHKNHPRVGESLDAAERNLRAALELFSPLALRVERGSLSLPLLHPEVAAHFLLDSRGELRTLAEELSRCGITSLAFFPETNLGELDTLAYLLNATLLRAGGVSHASTAAELHWPVRLAEHHISGIRVNTAVERRADTLLASFIAALLAYARPAGGETAAEAAADQGSEGGADLARFVSRNDRAQTLNELTPALELLTRLIPTLEQLHESPPPEAARTVHAVLAKADRQALALLAAGMTRHPPREGDGPAPYLARLIDALALEFVSAEFRAGRIPAPAVRELLARLTNAASAGGDEALENLRFVTGGASSLFARWADEVRAERLYERLWDEMPAQERTTALHSHDAWCVPTGPLRRHLEQLLASDPQAPPESSPREARTALLHYARGLEAEEGKKRRTVAAGLVELHPLFERVWPDRLPEELSRVVVRALERENSPGVAGLLAALTENLARLAFDRGDHSEFERIVNALEEAPRDPEHSHVTALLNRLLADERWLPLVDAALETRPLDPALPRLLRRDPERLLDRLGLLLTAPEGLDALPAMARLVRAMGESAIGALETRLFDPRRQRAATAVKLLAATQPERLVAALPRALPSWDWSLQDLAVAELARPAGQKFVPGVAQALLATVREAHPMVVPMMLDQIVLRGESAAVPLLLEIAAGKQERLRDIFIRIKAVEALGCLRAAEAAPLLRTVLRQRSGLTYVEPAGLRAAAEEALALIENRPSSARVRATYKALEEVGLVYLRPRRYLRVPLSSPFAARIEGPALGFAKGAPTASARVRTISLGGAFLESNRRLAVGDSLQVEIRAGLHRIRSTAIVRNTASNGGGVEFVHMSQEDREKLRRLVTKFLARTRATTEDNS